MSLPFVLWKKAPEPVPDAPLPTTRHGRGALRCPRPVWLQDVSAGNRTGLVAGIAPAGRPPVLLP
ncbi:MAG: hypothetical protein ABF535_11085, partial [Acetobacter sp.]